MKAYADIRRNAKIHHFKVGDTVLVKQQQKNKFQTPFNPTVYEISEVKGTMVTAVNNNHTITRNCSHFKIIAHFCFINCF